MVFSIPYFPLFGVNLFTKLAERFLFDTCYTPIHPMNTKYKLNVHKTFRRNRGRFRTSYDTHSVYVLCPRGNQYQKQKNHMFKSLSSSNSKDRVGRILQDKHWEISFRSSRPDVFCKQGVLRNFAKFTGKHLCQSRFINRVAGLRPANLLKKRL